MNISARSALMAGAATITASAVAIAPSVQPPPPPKPTIQLAASSQLLQQQQAVLQQFGSIGEATQFLAGIIIPPGLGTPPPAPPTIPPAPGPTSVASFVESAYLAIEPWVDYGFEVGAWAFGWVPWIGWLAPQIWPIGYNFGERLVRAIVFNITDWLQGEGSVIDNVVDWGAESIDALVQFGIDQWNFWIGFPLPPLPGIFTTPEQATMLVGPTGAPEVGVQNLGGLVRTLLDRVLENPLNADGDVDGAFKGGASLSSLIKNGIAEIGDLLGVPSSPGELEKTSEISTIPSFVKTPFAPLNSLRTRINTEADIDETTAGPLTEVTKTVRNVRKEIRADFDAATERRTEGAATNGVVRARGEVRGPVGKAVTDVVDALRGGKPNKDATEATTPTSVAKSLGETARKVVKDVRQAAKDARDAAKNRTTAGDDDE